MKYAPINAADIAVLFADLQQGIVERATTSEPERLQQSVAALAKLARLFEIATIVTTAPAGPEAPKVMPEIAASLGALPQHVRTTTDAFLDAPTRTAIERTGRKTLLIAGVATEIIVQHSALSARAHGLDVQVVIDACGGLSARTEEAALGRLVAAGVVITSVASLAGQLAGDFTQPKGAAAVRILYDMAPG